jgi:hypothetical protein
MLLARLAELAREVERDPTLSREISAASLYYYHASKWRSVDGSEVSPDPSRSASPIAAKSGRGIERSSASKEDGTDQPGSTGYAPI